MGSGVRQIRFRSQPSHCLAIESGHLLIVLTLLSLSVKMRIIMVNYIDYGRKISMTIALVGVAQWIECRPANQRVAGSIPSQGTCLGCEPGP